MGSEHKFAGLKLVQAALGTIALVSVLLSYQNCSPGFAPATVDSFAALASEDPKVVQGKSLYSANCSSCHGPVENSQKSNRSAAQITAAISAIPQMAILKSLSAGDIDAISYALYKRAPSDPLANPFRCEPGAEPVPAQLRRLTRREYVNTLLDLFAGQLTEQDFQSELGYVPAEALDARPAVKLFDAMNPSPANFKLISAFSDVAGKIADVITSSSAKMNAVGGNNCVSQSSVSDSCLDGFLTSFGLKAYRRPLAADEKAAYVALYRTGNSSTDSMARVIEAMLQAPQFLYLIEDSGSGIGGRTDLLYLSSYEMASRLSYMVLGSMPDSELFAAAAAGDLNTPEKIQVQVDRLFSSPKAKENVRHFYSEWLRLEKIPTMVVSQEFADGLNPAQFKSEAKQEIVDLMDHLLWNEKADFAGLMSTDLAVPKGPSLSRIYGVTASSQPQKLSDPNRKGLLTRAGLLSFSETGTQDPIKRGVRVRLHLLCDSLGTPPNDADSKAAPIDPLTSTRTQFATKTSPTMCMTCHDRINPLGFAFGHFDAFGRFISQETVVYNGQSRTHAIDARVEPAISAPSEPMIDGASELQGQIANNNKGPACVAQQWMQYNLGRQAENADACSLSRMYDSLTRPGGSLIDMLKSLAGTNAFRTKKIVSQ